MAGHRFKTPLGRALTLWVYSEPAVVDPTVNKDIRFARYFFVEVTPNVTGSAKWRFATYEEMLPKANQLLELHATSIAALALGIPEGD